MNTGSRQNPHIDYDQVVMPYHEVVAHLVCNYAPHDEASVLDVGCGVGHTLGEIKRRRPNFRFSGVDIDPVCLELTDNRIELESKIQVETLDDLFQMPLQYDVIIMSHVLEHLLRPVDALQGIMTKLVPHGIAVLAVPNPVRPTVFLNSLRQRNYANKGHVYSWDRSHWMNFLETILKLDVLCYSQDYIPLPIVRRFSKSRSLEKRLAGLFPWLAFSNIAVVRNSSEK